MFRIASYIIRYLSLKNAILDFKKKLYYLYVTGLFHGFDDFELVKMLRNSQRGYHHINQAKRRHKFLVLVQFTLLITIYTEYTYIYIYKL